MSSHYKVRFFTTVSRGKSTCTIFVPCLWGYVHDAKTHSNYRTYLCDSQGHRFEGMAPAKDLCGEVQDGSWASSPDVWDVGVGAVWRRGHAPNTHAVWLGFQRVRRPAPLDSG
jgi:hypothetical protein